MNEQQISALRALRESGGSIHVIVDARDLADAAEKAADLRAAGYPMQAQAKRTGRTMWSVASDGPSAPGVPTASVSWWGEARPEVVETVPLPAVAEREAA